MASVRNVNSCRLISSKQRIKKKKKRKKERKTIEPQGYGFDAVISLEYFTDFKDEKDLPLLYKVSKNVQYVFKSSSSKMHIANLMSKDSRHFLCEEYCYFE